MDFIGAGIMAGKEPKFQTPNSTTKARCCSWTAFARLLEFVTRQGFAILPSCRFMNFVVSPASVTAKCSSVPVIGRGLPARTAALTNWRRSFPPSRAVAVEQLKARVAQVNRVLAAAAGLANRTRTRQKFPLSKPPPFISDAQAFQ
jgi:hypothetical protein